MISSFIESRFIGIDGIFYFLTVPIKKPGVYQLRVAVRDESSERVGSASQFVEVLIAPKVADDARTLLAKKENVRVLEVPLSAGANALEFKRVGGGLLAGETHASVFAQAHA